MAIDGVSLVGKELRAVTDMLRGEAGKAKQNQKIKSKMNPKAVTDMLLCGEAGKGLLRVSYWCKGFPVRVPMLAFIKGFQCEVLLRVH